MNMKTRQSRRQTTKVSHSRWAAYAATVLAGTNSAEAAIHYSGRLEVVFPPHESEIFQLDQPGDYFWLRHLGGNASVVIGGIASAGFRGYVSSDFFLLQN